MKKYKPHRLQPLIKTLKWAWTAFFTAFWATIYHMNIVAELSYFVIAPPLAAFILTLLILHIFFQFQSKNTVLVLSESVLKIIKTGLFRSEKSVFIRDIASAVVEQSFFERPFSLYQVRVDLGSSATALRADCNIILSRTDAYELYNVMLGSKDISAGQSVIRFSFSDILRHSMLYSSSAALLLGVIAYLTATAMFSGKISAFGVGSISLATVAIRSAYEIIKATIQFQGFELKLTDRGIAVKQGFLFRRVYRLVYDCCACIIIEQPLLARVLGYRSIRAVNIGLTADRSRAQIICPCIKEPEFLQIVDSIFSYRTREKLYISGVFRRMALQDKYIIMQYGFLSKRTVLIKPRFIESVKILNTPVRKYMSVNIFAGRGNSHICLGFMKEQDLTGILDLYEKN